MDAQIWTLVAIIAAAVAVGATVVNVLFARRGVDGELKSDVEELALLVDRLAKTARRDKMARVRRTDTAETVQQQLPAGEDPQHHLSPKQQLRAAYGARLVRR